MKRATFVGIIYCLIFAVASARAESYRKFEKNLWDLELQSRYFQTSSNYRSGGATENLGFNGTYQLTTVTPALRAALTSEWVLKAAVNVSRSQSRAFDATRVNNSVSSAEVGTEYGISFDYFDLIPEVDVVFPIDRITPNQDSSINNEGVFEGKLILGAQSGFERFDLFGGLGVDFRGDSRSNLFLWNMGSQLTWGKTHFGAVIRGYQSINDDKDVGIGEAGRQTTVLRVNAGSCKFYCVNPSLTEAEVFFQWMITNSWDVLVSGGNTLTGSNQANGWFAGLTIGYRFNNSPVPRKGIAPRKEKISVEPYTTQFKEDTNDGVNQDLFKPMPPPAPRVKKSGRMLRTQPQPAPQNDEQSMQNALDDAEMKIELKNKKGRRK